MGSILSINSITGILPSSVSLSISFKFIIRYYIESGRLNGGTIVQQNSRGWHGMSFNVSVRVCLVMNHGTIFHKL